MGSTGPASLVVEGLSHRYRGADIRALRDVALSVRPGQRVGLLGPNGAGKSTLMRLVCGYLPIDAQTKTVVRVADLDVSTQSKRVRQRVGYMPEHVPLYAELRAREHLSFRAAIKRISRKRRAAEVQRVAELTAITHELDTPIAQLSRGYRQRVGLADALLGSPPLVVLDEPTVGLDPNQVRDVRAMLRELGGAQTLLFSSHILAEVEMLCDRVVILSHGEVVADQSIEAATTASHVHVRFDAPDQRQHAVIEAAATSLGVTWTPQPDGTTLTIDVATAGVDADAAMRALGEAARVADVAVIALRVGTTRLEERFAEVTGVRGGAESNPDANPDATEEDAETAEVHDDR